MSFASAPDSNLNIDSVQLEKVNEIFYDTQPVEILTSHSHKIVRSNSEFAFQEKKISRIIKCKICFQKINSINEMINHIKNNHPVLA